MRINSHLRTLQPRFSGSRLITMTNLSTFEQYYKLADRLIEKATKEQLAECARLLALKVAHYQGKFGEVPLEETLAMLDAEEPSDEQAQLLIIGMENLVGVLGTVGSELGEQKHSKKEFFNRIAKQETVMPPA